MNSCEQELCPFWGGGGCLCDVFGIIEKDRQRAKGEIGDDDE